MLALQHWSSRKGYDRCSTLWSGWAVLGPSKRFWFAGDTGYCGVFKDIGQKYGPFDLAAIPIGAYEPRWFMKPQHVDPQEAIQIHKASRIGTHPPAEGEQCKCCRHDLFHGRTPPLELLLHSV